MNAYWRIHIGFCLKWTIWASPGALFWVNFRSGVLITILFLIRQENAKYLQNPSHMKFDPLHFIWFNLHLDLFFEEIINLNKKCLFWPVTPAIPKIVIGAWVRWLALNKIVQFYLVHFSRRFWIWTGKFQLYYFIWLDWWWLHKMTSSIWNGSTCI